MTQPDEQSTSQSSWLTRPFRQQLVAYRTFRDLIRVRRKEGGPALQDEISQTGAELTAGIRNDGLFKTRRAVLNAGSLKQWRELQGGELSSLRTGYGDDEAPLHEEVREDRDGVSEQYLDPGFEEYLDPTNPFLDPDPDPDPDRGPDLDLDPDRGPDLDLDPANPFRDPEPKLEPAGNLRDDPRVRDLQRQLTDERGQESISYGNDQKSLDRA